VSKAKVKSQKQKVKTGKLITRELDRKGRKVEACRSVAGYAKKTQRNTELKSEKPKVNVNGHSLYSLRYSSAPLCVKK
jgi:hypothetical protein